MILDLILLVTFIGAIYGVAKLIEFGFQKFIDKNG